MPIGLFEGMIGDPDVPGTVYAGTGCRGVWVGELGVATGRPSGRPGRPRPLGLGAPSPNPAASAVRIALDAEGVGWVDVTVFDALGRRALTQTVAVGTGAVELDVSGLAPGTYTVRIEHDGARAARRLVIVR